MTPFLIAAYLLTPAAPVPKETEGDKIRRVFGALDDPDGTSSVALVDGMNLKFTAAKGLRGLNASRGLTNAPRTLRAVEGDFVATVKIVKDGVPAGAKKASDDYLPSGGGGLILWSDPANHVRISRSQWVDDDGTNAAKTTYNFRGSARGQDTFSQQQSPPGSDAKPVTLRLTRKGTTLSAAYTTDGTTWKTFAAEEVELPAAVKVGVYVAHNFDSPLEVVFEPLAVEPLPKK